MSRAWMPFYVADYLADTGHLSTLEHGAYMLLIMHYWQTGGLPADDEHLARVARMSGDEWNATRSSIASFFDGNWKHKRIERELASAKETYDKRSTAGRKGGKAKAASQHNSSNATSGLEAQLEPGSSYHNHNHKEKEEEKEKAGKRKKGAAMVFVELASPQWQAWQRVKTIESVWSAEHHANGWWFPSLWPEQQKQEG